MGRILFIGEAWGSKEHMFQHALIGSSGQEFGKMLRDAGIGPELPYPYPNEMDMMKHWQNCAENHEIFVGNVFNEKPFGNNVELFFTTAKEGLTHLPPLRAGKYLRPDMLHHIEALYAKVSAVKPNIIVALGNTACWALLGETRISHLRGTIKPSPVVGTKILPTYHPAAVLRQFNLRTIVLADLEKALRESAQAEIIRHKRYLTIEPTMMDILRWFQRPADYYAVDIENRGGPISMIGFARSPEDALVIPLMDETKPGWHYWPTIEEEMRAWRFIDGGLKKPVPKIFQNGIYDLSHLLRYGFRPTMCDHDTMLFHHSLYPEMLKGLGFLGSVYADEIAWKGMGRKGDNLKRDE